MEFNSAIRSYPAAENIWSNGVAWIGLNSK